MYDIEITEEFDDWLNKLRDNNARGFIIKRIRIISNGSLGETRSLGGGLFEAKIRYGPGYCLYFANKEKQIRRCLTKYDTAGWVKRLRT